MDEKLFQSLGDANEDVVKMIVRRLDDEFKQYFISQQSHLNEMLMNGELVGLSEMDIVRIALLKTAGLMGTLEFVDSGGAVKDDKDVQSFVNLARIYDDSAEKLIRQHSRPKSKQKSLYESISDSAKDTAEVDEAYDLDD